MKLATAMQRSCRDPQRGSGARRRLDAGWLRDATLGPDVGGGVVLGSGAGGGATLVSSCDGAMSIWACNLDGRLQVKRACKTYPNATINSIGIKKLLIQLDLQPKHASMTNLLLLMLYIQSKIIVVN